MKNIIHIGYLVIIVGLIVLVVWEKCTPNRLSTVGGTSVNSKDSTSLVRVDTSLLRDSVTFFTPRKVKLRITGEGTNPTSVKPYFVYGPKDTTNAPISTYPLLVHRDTIEVPTLPDSAYITVDSLIHEEAKLNYTIISQGPLIAFLPELQVYRKTFTNTITEKIYVPEYITRRPLFEIGAGLGYVTFGEKIYPTINLEVGIKNVSGTFFNHAEGYGVLLHYKKRF